MHLKTSLSNDFANLVITETYNILTSFWAQGKTGPSLVLLEIPKSNIWCYHHSPLKPNKTHFLGLSLP